jgi:hypothetical protein
MAWSWRICKFPNTTCNITVDFPVSRQRHKPRGFGAQKQSDIARGVGLPTEFLPLARTVPLQPNPTLKVVLGVGKKRLPSGHPPIIVRNVFVNNLRG